MEELNDKIWRNEKLIPEIKDKLLIIARKVIADLEVDVKVKQIIFTGSLASFVYRASSDIDLHIIVETEGDYGEITDEYFDMYCKLFNSYRSIFIRGYKLEVNIKREEKILDNKGVYNILTDEWIQYPSMPTKELTQDDEVRDVVIDYQDRIDDIINRDADLDQVNLLRKELKAMRTSGLAEDGEFSLGNLVFKELRHSGYLAKLFDYKLEKENEFLSFENFKGYFNSHS